MNLSMLHNNGVPSVFRGTALDLIAPSSDSGSNKTSGVRAEFDQIAQKTPAERMREALLKRLGHTEESLKDLPAEERQALELQLRKMIEQEAKTAAASGARPGGIANVTA
jgi:hypothetical protein